MKRISIIAMLFMMFFILSCQTGPILPAQWIFEEKAVHIRLKADVELNRYGGQAHTLYVCVYQLSDPNTFNQLSADQEGLYKLLECNLFDKSAATSERLIIRPGTDTMHTFNRAEGAKYVGLVAGYYTLKKERIVRLYNIPEIIEETGFWTKTRKSKPIPLSVELLLGSEQILKSKDEK